jgi:molybdate/tungstate transport system permease protein
MRFNTLNLAFAVLGGLILLFIVGPLAGMFIAVTPQELVDTINDEEVRYSLGITVAISLSTTLFFAISAIPLAYLLARKNFFMKNVIIGIIDLPIVIPHTAAGIAVLGIISRDTALGKFAEIFGLTLVGHPIGIGLAMAFVSVPFLINAAHDGFKSVPLRMEQAALTLNASPVRVFFSVSLPLAWRNIVSGTVMMFARGMSEFGAVVIIAYHPMITPVLIYERFGAFGLKYAVPVSVVFIMVSIIIFIAIRLLSDKPKNKINEY